MEICRILCVRWRSIIDQDECSPRSMGILLLQIRHARLGNSIGGSQEPHDFLSVAVNWS